MLYYAGLLFLIIAVSIDGFGVGITYGFRKISVPFTAISIIISCSGFIVLFSMTIGDLLSMFISPRFADIFGGSILICLGCFSLYNAIRSRSAKNGKQQSNDRTGTLQHVKTVFSKPDQADLDQSGSISSVEALLLGTALAMDAFGAGIAAAMIGYPPLLTSILIGVMSGLFLYFGIRIGIILSQKQRLQQISFLPAILLVIIGLANVFNY